MTEIYTSRTRKNLVLAQEEDLRLANEDLPLLVQESLRLVQKKDLLQSGFLLVNLDFSSPDDKYQKKSYFRSIVVVVVADCVFTMQIQIFHE